MGGFNGGIKTAPLLGPLIAPGRLAGQEPAVVEAIETAERMSG
jgi:hypothetical protein